MWEMRRKGQRAEDGSERRALHSVQMKDGCIQDRNAPRGKKIKSATLWPRRRSTKTGEQTRENTSRLQDCMKYSGYSRYILEYSNRGEGPVRGVSW